MIEKVVNRKNMRRAYQQVLRNEGSAGEDGMSVQELWNHLKVNRDKIATAVCNGSYLAQPILGIEIPKSKGKRLLGIPTVTDRMVQQAVSQVMSRGFEEEFTAHIIFLNKPNTSTLIFPALLYNHSLKRWCLHHQLRTIDLIILFV